MSTLVLSRRSGATAEVEGTAINPRPRPRAADSASKQMLAPPQAVQQPQQQQQQQPVKQPGTSANTASAAPAAQVSPPSLIDLGSTNTTAVCASGQPTSTSHSNDKGQSAEQNKSPWQQQPKPEDDVTSSDSLIDFGSSGSFVSSHLPGPSAVGTNQQVVMPNCQFVQYAMPWGPAGFIQSPAVGTMRYCSPQQRFTLPGQHAFAVPYCGATGLSQSYQYPAGYVGQPKTGSHNELHLVQVPMKLRVLMISQLLTLVMAANLFFPQNQVVRASAHMLFHYRYTKSTIVYSNQNNDRCCILKLCAVS